MTAHITMQSVLLFAAGGISSVCISFVLYWKLLAEKHMRKAVVTVQSRAHNRRQRQLPVMQLCTKGAR